MNNCFLSDFPFLNEEQPLDILRSDRPTSVQGIRKNAPMLKGYKKHENAYKLAGAIILLIYDNRARKSELAHTL